MAHTGCYIGAKPRATPPSPSTLSAPRHRCHYANLPVSTQFILQFPTGRERASHAVSPSATSLATTPFSALLLSLAGLFPTQVAQLRRDEMIEKCKRTALGAPRIKKTNLFLSSCTSREKEIALNEFGCCSILSKWQSKPRWQNLCTIFYRSIPAKYHVGKNKKICLGTNYIVN